MMLSGQIVLHLSSLTSSWKISDTCHLFFMIYKFFPHYTYRFHALLETDLSIHTQLYGEREKKNGSML